MVKITNFSLVQWNSSSSPVASVTLYIFLNCWDYSIWLHTHWFWILAWSLSTSGLKSLVMDYLPSMKTRCFLQAETLIFQIHLPQNQSQALFLTLCWSEEVSCSWLLREFAWDHHRMCGSSCSSVLRLAGSFSVHGIIALPKSSCIHFDWALPSKMVRLIWIYVHSCVLWFPLHIGSRSAKYWSSRFTGFLFEAHMPWWKWIAGLGADTRCWTSSCGSTVTHNNWIWRE